MEERWKYLSKSGERVGPLDEATLAEHYQDGLINSETFICRHTVNKWYKLGELRDLEDRLIAFEVSHVISVETTPIQEPEHVTSPTTQLSEQANPPASLITICKLVIDCLVRWGRHLSAQLNDAKPDQWTAPQKASFDSSTEEGVSEKTVDKWKETDWNGITSLTAFLEQKGVAQRFGGEFNYPGFTINKEMLAPPQSDRYSLIGTAFDYLMRFYIKKINPDAIAEECIAIKGSRGLHSLELNIDTGRLSWLPNEVAEQSEMYLAEAEKNYIDYLPSSGRFKDELLESAIKLAQLDVRYRAGIVAKDLGIVHQEDIEDLRNLVTLLKPDQFLAKNLCLLNPSFDLPPEIPMSADADLLIDETLIDIKTTKNFKLSKTYLNQLLGYVTLNEIGNIGGLSPKPAITKIAIYYSRHAYLHVMDLKEIIDSNSYQSFIQWFVEEVRKGSR